MTKPRQIENIRDKSVPRAEQSSIPVGRLLFNAATLVSAVVVCAIGGPKTPPWQGD